MTLILSNERAGQVLEEIGALQRGVEAGMDLETAGEDITERARAVANYFIATGSTNVFEPLIKPLMEWGMYSLGPVFLVDQTDKGTKFRAVYDDIKRLYDDYKYLDNSAG
jgi:hypothetical protein